jgi:peptide/nickel transport system substrate-binding protein
MPGTCWRTFVVVLTVVVAACAPSAPGSGRSSGEPAPQAVNPSRTLVIGMHLEPTTLAPRPPVTSGITPGAPTHIFSGWLIVSDGQNVPRPQLAERLPQLNTDDWQVFADGTMETRYTLRQGVAWHDGTPLTAEDVVFGWRVFTWSEMGVPTDPPIRYVQEVTAPDERTVIIKWKQPYAEAAQLATGRYGGVPPMPRHLLETKFRVGDVQAFLNDGYWTSQFVGSGPYRVERWEPGAFITAAAVPNFVDGRAAIEQIKLVFLPDPRTVVASLLSGDIHVAADEAIGFEQGTVLKKQWESTGVGKVLLTPNKTRYLQVQYKPDYVSPRAVTDLRVRRAILHATDRDALSGAILDGETAVAHSLAGPVEEYFGDLERVVPKYPFNPQQAERLLADAGYTRGRDSLFVDASGQRLSLELRSFAAEPGPTEAAILNSQWKQFGLDTVMNIIPAAQSQNLEMVSAFPALRLEQTGFTGDSHLTKLAGVAVATPEKRWAGVNRGGWIHPEYDRLYDIYMSSLDRSEKNRAALEAMRLSSEELAGIPLYYLSLASAYVATLEGMKAGYNSDTAWDNIYQWRWVG